MKLSEQQPQNKSQKSGGTQQINDIDEAISNLQLTLGQKDEGTKTVSRYYTQFMHTYICAIRTSIGRYL